MKEINNENYNDDWIDKDDSVFRVYKQYQSLLYEDNRIEGFTEKDVAQLAIQLTIANHLSSISNVLLYA